MMQMVLLEMNSFMRQLAGGYIQLAPSKSMAKLAKLRNIFPSVGYFLFFIFYVLLYICQAILIHFSKNKGQNSYDYNTKSAVMFTELIKLIMASMIYLKDHSIVNMYKEITGNIGLLMYYMVPSALYCIYNNLTYIDLAYYDPTTYYILLQFRIAVTGVIYQILFSKYLNRTQWASLLLLTFGCITKQLESLNFSSLSSKDNWDFSYKYLFFISVQIFCSCFAGVYNEYLLKEKQNEAHLMIQNVFMYLDSIVCNLIVIIASERENTLYQITDMRMFQNVAVICILFNNALCGIFTSYFIKMFNSIMKAYATGIEILLTAILSYIIFSISISIFTVLSILIVSYATYLYAKSPISSTTHTATSKPESSC